MGVINIIMESEKSGNYMDIYHSLTPEQRHIYWTSRKKARDVMKVPKGYHLHHKDTTLFYTDVERYIQWNPTDLIILSPTEHTALHNTGKNRKSDKHNPDKHKTAVGRRWCNNGEKNIYLKPNEPLPEGYNYGRIQNPNSLKAMNEYWDTHPHLTGEANPMSKQNVRDKVSKTKSGTHREYRADGTFFYIKGDK